MMRESFAKLFFVCSSILAAAQQNYTYIYMYDNAAIPNVQYNANIDGVTIPILQANADNCAIGGVSTSCAVPNTPPNSYTWPDAGSNSFGAWASHRCGSSLRGVSSPCTVNLSIKSVANGTSNNWAPQYIFTQAWANYAAQQPPNQWKANYSYPIGFTMTCTLSYCSGHYYQMTGAPSGGVCQSGTNQPTNLSVTGGTNPTPDGTCTWQDQLPINAPLQDVAVSSNYPGAIPAWSNAGDGSGTYGKNSTIVSGTANGHFYLEVSTMHNPCTPSGSNPGNWSTGGGTSMDTQCQWKDLGTAAALNLGTNSSTDPLSVVASGVPATWETPFAYSQYLFYQNALEHYVTANVGSAASQIQYIRTGVGIGEEASISGATGFEKYLSFVSSPPLTDAQMKGVWTYRALQIYANNASTMSGLSPKPNWVIMALVNCGTGLSTAPGTDCTWADVEAQGALSYAPYYGGYGSQGLQTTDLYQQQNIAQCQIAYNGKSCCSDNWCETRYYMIGAIPYIELQEFCVSTPAGGSGCIDDPNNSDASLSEVLVLATQHGTNVIELGVPEFSCAYDATSACYGTSAATATANAIQTAAAGLPSGTGTIAGKARLQGQGTIY